MSYFKTSYRTLKSLALQGRFEDVAGFLVLARHASGRAVAEYEPYKLSGAGVNGMREKAGLSEETGRGVIERLLSAGIIKPATDTARKASPHARWEIIQGELDLDLPHALIDPLKTGNAQPPLKRIKQSEITDTRAQELKDVSDTECKLDALMLLLALYHKTSMEFYGGVDPRCIYRQWDVKSIAPKDIGYRWGAEPESPNERAYHAFIASSLAHAQKTPWKEGKSLPTELTKRFWQAWGVMKDTRLAYEAVTLFDVSPENNVNAQAHMTLRVNDFHAGSKTKSGDPSLLRTLEETTGSQFAYYTPAENEREESEAMWVILPNSRGHLVGIWRPRFRAATPDVGAWIDKEEAAIQAITNWLYTSTSG